MGGEIESAGGSDYEGSAAVGLQIIPQMKRTARILPHTGLSLANELVTIVAVVPGFVGGERFFGVRGA